MKTKSTFFRSLPMMVLVLIFSVGGMNGWAQTSTQNFGTGTGSHESITASTSFLPAPTNGTSYARSGNNTPLPPIVMATASNPLGTTGTYVRAVASSSTSVSKFSPMVGYTGGTEFYTSFKVLFGDASAGATATSGDWSFFQGAGATYSNVSGYSSAHVFTGLQFLFGAGGDIALAYRVTNPDRWSSTLKTLSSGTVYTIEIVGNNKTSGTINYTYGVDSETVAVQRFDLYINGVKVGDDLASSALPAGTAIDSNTFIGVSSTANVANIFVDDVVVYNSVPSTIDETLSNKDYALSDNEISVYPVPATDNVVLKVDASTNLSDQIVSYQLYDINGKLLQSDAITGDLTNISLQNLNPAVYFVKVFGKGQGTAQNVIKTLKIIKK